MDTVGAPISPNGARGLGVAYDPFRPGEVLTAPGVLPPSCPLCKAILYPVATSDNGSGDELFECLNEGYEAVHRVARNAWEPRPRPNVDLSAWKLPLLGDAPVAGPSPVVAALPPVVPTPAPASPVLVEHTEALAEAEAAWRASHPEQFPAASPPPIQASPAPSLATEHHEEPAPTTRRPRGTTSTAAPPAVAGPPPALAGATPDDIEWLTLADAAAIIGGKADAVYRRVRRGTLSSKRGSDGKILVRGDQLMHEEGRS